jgi:hypothetical protein
MCGTDRRGKHHRGKSRLYTQTARASCRRPLTASYAATELPTSIDVAPIANGAVRGRAPRPFDARSSIEVDTAALIIPTTAPRARWRCASRASCCASSFPAVRSMSDRPVIPRRRSLRPSPTTIVGPTKSRGSMRKLHASKVHGGIDCWLSASRRCADAPTGSARRARTR